MPTNLSRFCQILGVWLLGCLSHLSYFRSLQHGNEVSQTHVWEKLTQQTENEPKKEQINVFEIVSANNNNNEKEMCSHIIMMCELQISCAHETFSSEFTRARARPQIVMFGDVAKPLNGMMMRIQQRLHIRHRVMVHSRYVYLLSHLWIKLN